MILVPQLAALLQRLFPAAAFEAADLRVAEMDERDELTGYTTLSRSQGKSTAEGPA